MQASWTHQTTAVAIVLLIVTAWRWHAAEVADPDRIPEIDAPTAVLLVRADDCPDRRAAMTRWSEGAAKAALEGMPVRWMVAAVDGREPGLAPELDALPRLDRPATARAARALLRAGLDGTPALLLLDGEGRVVLADHFTLEGAGNRLMLAAELTPLLAPEPRTLAAALPASTTPEA